jgi:hypothetical protein
LFLRASGGAARIGYPEVPKFPMIGEIVLIFPRVRRRRMGEMMMDAIENWHNFRLMRDGKMFSLYTRVRWVKVLDVFWGNPRGIIF